MISSERRFNKKLNYLDNGSSPQEVGPGSYYKPDIMVKKSFNMNIEGASYVWQLILVNQSI